jgi:hypothetical protein
MKIKIKMEIKMKKDIHMHAYICIKTERANQISLQSLVRFAESKFSA